MSAIEATGLLRAGLLEGVSVFVAAPPGQAQTTVSFAASVAQACAGVGARVHRGPEGGEPSSWCDETAMNDAVDGALAQLGGIDVLVVDAATFAADERWRLRACVEGAWNVTRAVVNRAFLPAEQGGRIVYLAPAAGAVAHVDAACAGLENLARTLSIEWARHGITTVTIAPALETAAEEVAALTAYLASVAGAYFSGCMLDLRGLRAAHR